MALKFDLYAPLVLSAAVSLLFTISPCFSGYTEVNTTDTAFDSTLMIHTLGSLCMAVTATEAVYARRQMRS